MARRRYPHEDHVNHEAWAIPYGDLITLLLAFFVVMYALSSVNEGKYRVLSDSLQSAFQGKPDTVEPVQTGPQIVQFKNKAPAKPAVLEQAPEGQPPLPNAANQAGAQGDPSSAGAVPRPPDTKPDVQTDADDGSLARVADNVESEMADLIAKNTVAVRRRGLWVEVEVRTDILFASGVAILQPSAQEILGRLADTLKPFPNAIRVEGHTDNRPINNIAFPSNWELSAARAASVVHQFMRQGVDPLRLEIVGFGEFHPRQTNTTLEGRNANRRVVVLVLEQVSPGAPMTTMADEHTPGTAAPGVELADGSTGANRLMYRVPPATLEQAVMSKEPSKPQADEQPKTE